MMARDVMTSLGLITGPDKMSSGSTYELGANRESVAISEII